MALRSVFLLPSYYILTDRVPSPRRTTAPGLTFISADHLLLPPSTEHDVLKDISNFFAFLVRTPTLSTVPIDSTLLAVAGSSACGMCGFLAAIHANPLPRVVLSLLWPGWGRLREYSFALGHKWEVARPDLRRTTDLSCRTAPHRTARSRPHTSSRRR